MLLLPYCKYLAQGYLLVKGCFKVLGKVLSLLVVLWVFFCIICLSTALPTGSSSQTEWALKSPLLALQFFSKGFDLSSVLKITDFSLYFSLQSTLFFLVIGIPFNCLCVTLMLKYMSREAQEQHKAELKELINAQPELGSSRR